MSLGVGESARAEPDREREEDDHPLTHHQRGRETLVEMDFSQVAKL